MISAQQVEYLFLDCFYGSHRTRLLGGAAEPLYAPATGPGDAIIHYREDFAASALHEIAHWCVAGPGRLQQEDYGYWYSPDGRSAQQQRAFEKVEVVPQAIEWHFALACGLPFRVSADNLSQTDSDGGSDFARAVLQQARQFCEQALPQRALLFRAVLASYCERIEPPCVEQFQLQDRAA